jgi:sugar lactone lactonase YvrE
LYHVASQVSQLIYQNQHKLLGLSDPVWHPSGKVLAFSNYEFPIFVHFDNNAYRVEEWQQPLGVVKDWYAHDKALLTYSRKHKTAHKVNLDTQQTEGLGPVPHRFILLDPTDRLLSISGNQLLSGTNLQTTVEFPGVITRLVKLDEQRILLQLDHSLIEYDVLKEQALQEHVLPSEVTEVYGRLDKRFVVNNQSQQKDIIQLHLARE